MSFAFWAYLAFNIIFIVWLLGTGNSSGNKATIEIFVSFAITFVVVYLPLKLIGGFIRRRRN